MCSFMKAIRRACRSLVLAEYSKSTVFSRLPRLERERSAPRRDAFHLFPPQFGHHPRPAPDLDCVLARRGSVDDPAHDALGDAGGTEHVVRDIEVPVVGIDRPAAGVA